MSLLSNPRKTFLQSSSLYSNNQPQSLPEADKAPYVTAAEELKAASDGGKKSKSTSNGPKLPRSAYALFCNEERGKLAKGLNVAEQAKELSARWKRVGEEGKLEVQARLEKMRRDAQEAGEETEGEAG